MMPSETVRHCTVGGPVRRSPAVPTEPSQPGAAAQLSRDAFSLDASRISWSADREVRPSPTSARLMTFDDVR